MAAKVNQRRPYDYIKRVLDFVGALILLLLLWPVLLIVAVLVRLKHGSPVLFRQKRPGENERIFRLAKFRTMRAVDEVAGLVTDEQRLTSFGRLLRATSLDELPSLWNVLRGEMSFVGPRPLLTEYLPLYDDVQRRRHEVRPGITGLAQAYGRNSLSWDEKFRLDVEYVEKRGPLLDLKILFKTLSTVLRRDGVSHDGHETMPKFGEG